MDNAIKFTQCNGTISVSLIEDNEFRVLTIEDNGPGISHNAIEKVFDRFYRDQDQMSTEGSGLGLSLVNAVINLHKATIKLENKDPGLKVVIHL